MNLSNIHLQTQVNQPSNHQRQQPCSYSSLTCVKVQPCCIWLLSFHGILINRYLFKQNYVSWKPGQCLAPGNLVKKHLVKLLILHFSVARRLQRLPALMQSEAYFVLLPPDTLHGCLMHSDVHFTWHLGVFI